MISKSIFQRPIITSISKWISNLFNPLLSLIFYLGIYYSTHLTFIDAFQDFTILFSIIILPIVIWIIWNVKKGKYTNGDVSDRKQRKSLYIMFSVLFILYFTFNIIFNLNIRFEILFLFLIILVLQVSNYFIKSSMHTALNIFTSALLFLEHYTIGIVWFIISIIVAFSRLILKKHTLAEVFVGAVLSIVISFIYLYTHIVLDNY